MLNHDTLLQIFIHYRLQHKEHWSTRFPWLKLTHICPRWRYLVYDSLSALDICLRLTNNSPSIQTLSHLPPLPLVITYSDRMAIAPTDENNILFGLEQYGRVRRVDLQAPSSSLRMWACKMNQPFPGLEELSLSSTTTETSLVLPDTLQAPDLRHLAFDGIGLPITLLSSTFALSTLSLRQIRASCYFSPRHLVTLLQGLPRLEELTISFAISIPRPSSEGELLPAPIPPVTLPNLRQLKFEGVDVYLDNLVTQINTPLLERLDLTLHFDIAFTLVNLTGFIQRAEGFRCLVCRVIFNEDGTSIDSGNNEQQGIGKSSLHVNVNCKPLDWQIGSAAEVCSALGEVLSAVEDLTLDLHVIGMPSDWESTFDGVLWHELLLPFTGVKKLHIGSSLSLELSNALESDTEGLFLPSLQELKVSLKTDRVINALAALIETRETVGRPIHLLVPPEDEEEKIHLQNTLAVPRNRRKQLEYHWQRKLEDAVQVERKEKEMERRENEMWKAHALEHQRNLEDAIEAERKEKEIWKERALALEESLNSLNDSLSESFSGGFRSAGGERE